MICNIIEESTRNQADLDIKWSIFTVIMPKVVICRIQAANLHKFNGISAFIFPQSENISATNGRVVTTFCISALNIPYINNNFQLNNNFYLP